MRNEQLLTLLEEVDLDDWLAQVLRKQARLLLDGEAPPLQFTVRPERTPSSYSRPLACAGSQYLLPLSSASRALLSILKVFSAASTCCQPITALHGEGPPFEQFIVNEIVASGRGRQHRHRPCASGPARSLSLWA